MVNVAMVTSWNVRCGIATYSKALSLALSKQGVNVYIIRLPRFGTRTPNLLRNISEKIPTDKIDIIHCQHEYGLLTHLESSFFPALKEHGKPIITTMHAVGAWETDQIVKAFSDRIIVHNKYCFKRFGKNDKTGIIPHGASPIQSPPPPKEQCKRRIALQENAPIVGYLGFITPYKGLETMIEAMTKVKKAGLLIGGGWHIEQETAYIVNLRDWSLKALPARCKWLGYVSDSDLERVYGAMDVFVYPSRFATESGALIMALSHGKAVITRNVAPFVEKEKLGALMTFKNVAELTRKIKLLLRDEDKRKDLEEKALNYARENSWEEVAKKHIALYGEVLAT